MSRHAKNFDPHVSPDVAKHIMGENFFSVSDAICHLGVYPSEAQLIRAGEVPFSEATLKQCKDTHFLFVYFSQSILDLIMVGMTRFPVVHPTYRKPQRFYNETSDHGWHLLRKAAVPRSHYRNWRAQQQLLKAELAVPSAAMVAYMMIAYHRVAGRRLFEEEIVRTMSVDNEGFHVRVGLFEKEHILVDGDHDDHVGAHIGIAEKVMPSR